jgi:arabinan endo-1,5-alpha-L-arabinosidase
MRLRLTTLLLTAMLFAPFLRAQEPEALSLTGDYLGTHDPSIIKAGDTWYVFATGKAHEGGQFQIRCSTDLHAWKLCGQVFDAVPDWIKTESPRTFDLWAPDISYENGEYRLYYCYSLFGKNTSGIALLINKTLDPQSPDYHWVDRGPVLKSVATDDFNAIDPNYVAAGKQAWLVFGSYWTGIQMRRLDGRTGMLSKKDTNLYSMATRKRPDGPNPPRGWEAVEAPFIVHHGGYYYLFVSWDFCCRGAKSNYRTMVGRSKHVQGPYVDRDGVPMLQGGGTQLLVGNERWVGPGGESVLLQPGGQDILAFHAYDAQTGMRALQISTLTWTDDWPHAALGH